MLGECNFVLVNAAVGKAKTEDMMTGYTEEREGRGLFEAAEVGEFGVAGGVVGGITVCDGDHSYGYTGFGEGGK